jgi:alpha-mannosidase
MKLIQEQIKARINEFAKSQYWFSIKERIEEIHIAREPLEKPFDFSRLKGDWAPFRVGDSWPELETYFWLHIPIQIPKELSGKTLELSIHLSQDYSLHTPEGFVYINGRACHGIDRNHYSVMLPTQGKRNRQKIEAAIRVYTGQSISRFHPARVLPQQLAECSLVQRNNTAYEFYVAVKVLFDVSLTIDDGKSVKYSMIETLKEAFEMIDYTYPRSEEFYQSIETALKHIQQRVNNISIPPLPERVTCVGHAHIDLAWLWTLSRTKEKAIHTFSSVIQLMERYPDYRFFQSQPQLYQFVRKERPELFKKIQQKIDEGRWEADGGMWVESDCNLPSGESLVRQFLYGQRYFEQELNTRCSVLWLPDVFGYSWALPQILLKAEIPYFITSKISWNQYNEFPHDTFRWKGIDGSEVLTYYITTPSDYKFHTYNGLLEVQEAKGTWERYKQKEIHDEVLLVFGYGDGGGGPTEDMLQTARAMNGMPEFPQVKIGRVDEFCRRLEHARDKAPIWNGELYLEYHRGTYTSQAKNKRWNRQAEFALGKMEFLAVLSELHGQKYPRKPIREIWERLLLNQFHDIIPGSSVNAVYEDSAKDYEWIFQQIEKHTKRSLKKYVRQSSQKRSSYVLVNPYGIERSEPFYCSMPIHKAGKIELDDGKLDAQPCTRVDGELQWIVSGRLNPFSLSTGKFQAAEIKKVSVLSASKNRLENESLCVQLNSSGEISSIYDKKHRREIVHADNVANQFQAFEDKPIDHDAWDIDFFYQDKLLSTGDMASIKVVEKGPLRATVEIEKPILDGIVKQHISLFRDSRRIDFDTQIEWFNKNVLLKVAFPVDIHSTMATYDIQFGNVQRATHWNTSWDWAQFETCAHKWVDLSEGDYGVSLLNDCKYGHDVHEGVIRLTLIKSPSAPDPLADVGTHRFSYSLVPHSGGWRDARIPQKAYEFNTKPLVVGGVMRHPMVGSGESFLRCDKDHVIIDTVKWAEEDDAVIVRLYECFNQRGEITLTFCAKLKQATECNLLERNDNQVNIQGNSIRFTIKPYEIRTFKLYF